MTKTPEQEARETIDQMLDLAGWAVQDLKNANIRASRGVAIQNFPLTPGHGFFCRWAQGAASEGLQLPNYRGALRRR